MVFRREDAGGRGKDTMVSLPRHLTVAKCPRLLVEISLGFDVGFHLIVRPKHKQESICMPSRSVDLPP